MENFWSYWKTKLEGKWNWQNYVVLKKITKKKKCQDENNNFIFAFICDIFAVETFRLLVDNQNRTVNIVNTTKTHNNNFPS